MRPLDVDAQRVVARILVGLGGFVAVAGAILWYLMHNIDGPVDGPSMACVGSIVLVVGLQQLFTAPGLQDD